MKYLGFSKVFEVSKPTNPWANVSLASFFCTLGVFLGSIETVFKLTPNVTINVRASRDVFLKGKQIQYPPTGGFWKLLNTQKPPETWGVQGDLFHPSSRKPIQLTKLLRSRHVNGRWEAQRLKTRPVGVETCESLWVRLFWSFFDAARGVIFVIFDDFKGHLNVTSFFFSFSQVLPVAFCSL